VITKAPAEARGKDHYWGRESHRGVKVRGTRMRRQEKRTAGSESKSVRRRLREAGRQRGALEGAEELEWRAEAFHNAVNQARFRGSRVPRPGNADEKNNPEPGDAETG
jgi:hypothetical protein